MKLPKRFFAEADDNKGGESKGGAVFDETPGAAEKEVVKEEVKTTPALVDASALAKEFGSVLGEHFKTPVKEEPTVDQLTPEEAKKLLNVWEPTKEWETKFDNLETRGAALQELRDGVVKNGDTISQYRMRELRKELDGKYAPVLTFMENYQNERAMERFAKKYDQLADPALEPVISAITDKLKKSGKKFETEDALFDAIGVEAEKVIKVSNPNFKLTAGSSPATTKTKSQSSNSIPVTTPGAGGGSAARNDGPEKKRGLSIFD